MQILCAVGAVYFGAKVAMALGRDVRHGIFSRVLMFSDREVNHLGTASLITRTTNDVQQVQMLAIMTFTLLLSAPIMCVGGIILALNQNVPLSSLLLVAVPLLGIIVTLIISRMRPLFRQMQERLDNINRVLREQITGVRVIRAFVRDPQERDRFAVASNQLFDVSLGAGKLMALMFPSVHAGAQPVHHRGGVVRRAPGRRRHDADRVADRVHHLPGADPDVGDDGDVHVHAGAAGRGQRGADHGGHRHRAGGRPRRPARCTPARSPAGSSCGTWSSATPAPRSRCCTTSA